MLEEQPRRPFGSYGIQKAASVSIIEEKLNNNTLRIENNKIKDVPIGKFAIETLRLTYK